MAWSQRVVFDALVPPVRLRGPLGVYMAGVALTLAAAAASMADLGPLLGIAMVAGLIAAGTAVAWRLQTAGWTLAERLQSALLILAAGLLAEVDLHLLPPLGAPRFDQAAVLADWQSARMFFRALLMVSTAGAVLIALPRLGRRVALSALVLLHFGGIFTAVCAVEPPGAQAPWLAMQVWTHFYRPYLTFMYLNNAYHFYSPDPGPPTLVWFYVRYADDQAHWVKIPVRKESPVPLHYQRLLALTESTNMMNAVPPPEPVFNQKLQRRTFYGSLKGIPLHPLIAAQSQYREPQPYSKAMVSAYARFAARHFHHLTDPNIPVTSVRVYKVIHHIIPASDLAQGFSPLEKSLYMPYFMGEFDRDGQLLDENDPFLYWLIPIYPEHQATHFEPAASGGRESPVGGKPDLKIIDCLDIHKDLRSAQPEGAIP